MGKCNCAICVTRRRVLRKMFEDNDRAIMKSGAGSVTSEQDAVAGPDLSAQDEVVSTGFQQKGGEVEEGDTIVTV